MEKSKLMTPLFYGNMFNREGRKMRAILEREISDGTQTYRLWRSARKPNLKYRCAENDKYILYVEINGYLLSLRTTDCYLIDHCGFAPAMEKLYGEKENRGKRMAALQESGGSDAICAALAEERAEIERFGSDPVHQTAYIHSLLTEHVDTYQEAKENGGQTFPDFAGALILDDLARCQELSTVYMAKLQEEKAARQARAEAEEKAYCEEQDRAAEQAVLAAIQVIQNGGVLENTKVRFYQNRYSASSYSIVNYLMRLYHVDVPLRTQGWINKKLASATIQDGKCEHLQYYPCKNCRCSQKFFDCMNALIRAVTAQAPNRKDAA